MKTSKRTGYAKRHLLSFDDDADASQEYRTVLSTTLATRLPSKDYPAFIEVSSELCSKSAGGKDFLTLGGGAKQKSGIKSDTSSLRVMLKIQLGRHQSDPVEAVRHVWKLTRSRTDGASNKFLSVLVPKITPSTQ